MRRAELTLTRRTVRNYVRLFNMRLRDGESMRVYPLSNRTEHDVWEYLAAEEIDVVLLYFAAVRPVVRRGGSADGNDRVWGGNACRDRRRIARHAAVGATRPADR